MSKEKRRVPKLRFPGFTEDWEQRKLDELTIFIGDGLHGTPKYDENGSYYFINGNNLVDNKVSVTEETKKVAFEALGNDDRRLDSTAILMSINGTIGTLARYNNENIMLGKSVAYITPKNINRDFLFYQLQGNVIQSYFYKNLTGTTIKNLGLGTIKNTIVMSTLSEEESTIGRFFYKLDQYITLHQRKLNNLKLKKKALLQKLFPKNGERYPELRFPGFTDAWEQRKLNEFLSVSNLKNAENKYNKKDVLSVSGDYGIVNQIDFQGRSFAGASVSNYGVVEKGDIVYTKSPLKLNPYGIIKTNRLNNGIVSTLYAIYKTKENCDSKFIEHYFNLDSRLNQYLKPLVNKGAKNDMKVSSENALIGEVCFPKITEQVLIADLLDCLDIYITLHQRKLDHLQLQKKALLQQMFV